MQFAYGRTAVAENQEWRCDREVELKGIGPVTFISSPKERSAA